MMMMIKNPQNLSQIHLKDFVLLYLKYTQNF